MEHNPHTKFINVRRVLNGSHLLITPPQTYLRPKSFRMEGLSPEHATQTLFTSEESSEWEDSSPDARHRKLYLTSEESSEWEDSSPDARHRKLFLRPGRVFRMGRLIS
ncbi:hypothetical protein TNIN_411951 [Trichonephila inaurata madagascariensis]|uniref:Uncharacterized protein n=1 Tax=Trichonephila inaurata madagascariensis TaxID=2747483 RepID=A0A8X6Y2F4_9ARAC|nr:hypothetical protein TNIN_411951 [Trichonephila inaurata madagascariensis]